MAARFVALLQLAAVAMALLSGLSRASYCEGSRSKSPLLDYSLLKGSSAVLQVLNGIPFIRTVIKPNDHTCDVYDDSKNRVYQYGIPLRPHEGGVQVDDSCIACRLTFTFDLMNREQPERFTPRLPKYDDQDIENPLPFLDGLLESITSLRHAVQMNHLYLTEEATMRDLFEGLGAARKEDRRRFSSGGMMVIYVHGARRGVIDLKAGVRLPSVTEYFGSIYKYRLVGVISRSYCEGRPNGMYVATVSTTSPFLGVNMWKHIYFGHPEASYATQKMYYASSPFKLMNGHAVKMVFYVRV